MSFSRARRSNSTKLLSLIQLDMNIQAPSEWNGVVELHDLSGRLIHRSSAASGIWEQSPTVDLANGVYIVSIKDNTGGYQSFKWIKM
jgi:hypothetical protein